MEPVHSRNRQAPPTAQEVDDNDPKSLMDAEYVARLRPSSRSELDGLVIGDPEAFDVVHPFVIGEWILSKAAAAALTRDEMWVVLLKHGSTDWGNVSPETAEANFQALQHGGELRSAYYTPGGVRFTVVTNAERTRTTIQLEQEQGT